MKRSPVLRMQFLVVGAALTLTGLLCPFRIGVVYGHSMAPTLHPGELCVLDRSFYQHNPVRRGDIVVFNLDQEVLTKRVYAAPGDTIPLLRYSDGTYEILSEREDKLQRTFRSHRHAIRLVKLMMGPNECFVVGDNTGLSCDSRQFGPIDTSTLIGKMVTGLN